MSLREAAQQALKALEKEARSFEDWLAMMKAARTTLRAALAEDALQRLTDVQQEMESVTDCHEKGGDNLSPPLHVGYRYQSPVGGWEYGDHIPAGFDTDKWAHQKIYILQEQS